MCSPDPGEYARIPMRDRRDTVEVQAKQFLIDHLWSGEAHASERLIIEESVIIAVPTAKSLCERAGRLCNAGSEACGSRPGMGCKSLQMIRLATRNSRNSLIRCSRNLRAPAAS